MCCRRVHVAQVSSDYDLYEPYVYTDGQDDAWCTAQGDPYYFTGGNNSGHAGCGSAVCCRRVHEAQVSPNYDISYVHYAWSDVYMRGEAWSQSFEDEDFTHFLFATGDCRVWLVTTRLAVLGFFGTRKNVRSIVESATSTLESAYRSSTVRSNYTAEWVREESNTTTPHISVTSNRTLEGDLLYAGGSWEDVYLSLIHI